MFKERFANISNANCNSTSHTSFKNMWTATPAQQEHHFSSLCKTMQKCVLKKSHECASTPESDPFGCCRQLLELEVKVFSTSVPSSAKNATTLSRFLFFHSGSPEKIKKSVQKAGYGAESIISHWAWHFWLLWNVIFLFPFSSVFLLLLSLPPHLAPTKWLSGLVLSGSVQPRGAGVKALFAPRIKLWINTSHTHLIVQ